MDNIILVGMMGSGKSTLSHLLHEKIGYSILDTDDAIEILEKSTIALIFEKKGEATFRALEKAFLQELDVSKHIISTGGGMVIQEANVKRLRTLGRVFYLRGTVDTLVQRLTSQTSHRPLLLVEDLRQQIKHLLERREALYVETAHHIIDIDEKTPEAVVCEIYAILRELDYKF